MANQCDAPSVINFIILTVIRGTTPLMLAYAIEKYNTTSLVVLLKCGITFILFSVSAVWQFSRDAETRRAIKISLRDSSVFWRLCVVGFLQSFAPYIFILYSLKSIPLTVVGAFIVTVPWWSTVIERLPFVKLRQHIPVMIKVGMLLGVIGTSLMLGPVVIESLNCRKALLINTTNLTTLSPPDECLKPKDIGIGMASLLLAPILWGMASVYWKCQRRDTHSLVQSIGQNVIGGLFALLMFGITSLSHTSNKPDWTSAKSISSILFLGGATGWLATLIIQNLYWTIGGKLTNQVLTGIPFIVFLEELLTGNNIPYTKPYVVAMVIIGMLFVTGGVFISNLPSSEFHETDRRSSFTEPLLNDTTPSEGVRSGSGEVYVENVLCYKALQDENETETEEEINCHVDAIPPLTAIS